MTIEKERTERYDPATIEPKWQEEWVRSGLHDTPDTSDKPNFYFLTMFPYPSGEIHVGHWYAFAPPDCAARFMRMNGHNVLFPMGFDAFGINAENAAIDRKIHPAVWTEKNMAHMRDQFRRMGTAIDWRREVITCYPEYYRWNQWMFLKLYEKGLAYRGEAPVNWCPRDETVLANEQVIGGRCERCDTPVEKRQMTQWFYRITKYADELLRFEGLDWPERVRVLQTNWIGRSEGAEITFPVEGHPGADIKFFTTRPDTIYGATFMVLAPEHPLVERITTPAQREQVRNYVDHARNMAEIERTTAEREKTGIFTGAYAKNVFTGERVPIWIADYVLLPVELPRDVEFTGRGGSPLAHVPAFVNTTCPKCGKPARRDTDTMDTFVDSSWYMYRYVDPKIDTAFMNAAIGKKWLPVHQYTGGVEHAILHLLYMRFMAKALRDLGELWFDEPVTRFRYQGTIVFKGRKMSKSRGNVQTPDEYVKRYGADTLRLFMMFMGPWVDGADWDASGIEGVHRFLRRVWDMASADRQPAGPREAELDRKVQRAIKRVTEDVRTYSFNTAVAAMMELSNALQKGAGPSRDEGIATIVLLLAPFAPHMTDELWHKRGGQGSVHQQRWPTYDELIAAPAELTIVVQVNGKLRDRIVAPAGSSEDALRSAALASPKVRAALAGASPKKVIVVADRLVSIVTR